jgi:ADP-heptose:LPS heptosyltransferase
MRGADVRVQRRQPDGRWVVSRFVRAESPAVASVIPRSIAIVRLDHLGDHVLGSGVLRALKEHYTGARLVMVVPQALVELYARCPFLDAILPLPDSSKYLLRVGPRHYVGNPPALASLLERLSCCEKFDLVLNARFSEDYFAAGAIARALAAPGARIIGFRQSRSPIRDCDPNAFYTDLIDAPESLHTAEYASVIASTTIGTQVAASPEIWTSPEDWARASARWRLVPGEFVVVGVGSSAAFKVPSIDVYAKLLNYLLSTPYCIVLVGDRREMRFAEAIRAAVSEQHRDRIVSTAGQLRLAELGTLLSKARLYVGPDAGPKHMAAAACTPVVEVCFVPGNYPAFSRGWQSAGGCWRPWNTPFRVVHPDAAAFRLARSEGRQRRLPIPGISTDSLLSAVEQILADTSQTRSGS